MSITRHNRRSVVVLSDAEYHSLAQATHSALQREVKAGFDQLDHGEVASRTPKEISEDVRKKFSAEEL